MCDHFWLVYWVAVLLWSRERQHASGYVVGLMFDAIYDGNNRTSVVGVGG
jgi:hypothetical protein